MKLISRKKWGARPPKRGVERTTAAARTEFVVHHSGGPAAQSVRAIQDHCMDARGFLDIDYNFLVGQDGTVYVGRGWDAVGSHTSGHNTSGLGVCVIGTNQLNIEAMYGLQELYAEACKRAGHRLAMRVHSDLDATDCPGNTIRAWVKAGHLDVTPEPRDLWITSPWLHGHDVERVQKIVGVRQDGIFGPVTGAAVERWQRAHDLAADGIVGPKTRAKMGI